MCADIVNAHAATAVKNKGLNLMALLLYWHVLCSSRLFSPEQRTHNTQAKFLPIRSSLLIYLKYSGTIGFTFMRVTF